ncbi:MAG: sugar ABC transporter permease [Caldilineaceae bacterium]|nr:sugar ABC transporter permease [Caldilineaceae bacterium]
MKNEMVNRSASADAKDVFDRSAPTRRAPLVILAGRQGRRIRESLLAYLFLAPAFIIVGLFGIFPIVFAAYQSTLIGINRILGTYDGFGNYLRAVGNLTYILGFGGSLLLIGFAVYMIWRSFQEARAFKQPFWRWSLSGMLIGAGGLMLFGWLFRLLPLLLAIPEQLRTRQRTPEPFTVLLNRALTDSSVLWIFTAAFALLVIGIILSVLFQQQEAKRTFVPRNFTGLFAGVTFLLGTGGFILLLTWVELQVRTAQAGSTGGLDIWSQILVVSAGFVLLGLSWWLWQSASGRPSNVETGLRLAGGAMLLVAAWLLIGELPRVIGSGDRVWWNSLSATFYYALGTVPTQLVISLMLAVLLFQEIKGRSFFRIVYFLPYIAPFVGTAAVFKLLFSSRPAAPINAMLGGIGLPSLRWLNEPGGVLSLSLSAVDLPAWAVGPSLALVVIMIYGVWTFFGFNTVVFLAGLGNIPREMYEAASIDGANKWAHFRHITLPLLSPTIYFLTLYSVIGTFKAFNHIFVLRTGAALGTTDTASVVIFQMFNRDTRYGYASALAILLLLIIILLTVINNRIASRRVHYG